MIYEYVKNITLIAIFLALIEMVLPSQKFSKYIKLVLGFILMMNIVLPFVDFNKYTFELKDFNELDFYNEKFDYSPYVEASENIKNQSIDSGIEENIKNLFVSDNYVVTDVFCEYETSNIKESNIKGISSIHITLEKNNLNNEPKGSDVNIVEPIKVEKISVKGLTNENNVSNNEENQEILNLKNIISKEYNLSNGNIYVNIKD